MKNLIYMATKLSLVLALLSLTACGGGGGGTTTPPVTQQQAVVSMALTGGADTIGSLQFDLVLPAGFSLATDTQGNLDSGVLTVAISGSSVDSLYLPEDNQNFGQLTLGMAKASGFSPGLFATLIHDMVSGESLPLSTDFSVNSLLVSDLNGVPLTGYSLALTLQQRTVTP